MLWRKSTFSATGSSCVELAEDGGLMHVRNSIHPDRGTLRFPPVAVADLVAASRAGELDDLATPSSP